MAHVVSHVAAPYSDSDSASNAGSPFDSTGAVKIYVLVIWQGDPMPGVSIGDNKSNISWGSAGDVVTWSSYPSYAAVYETLGEINVGTNHVVSVSASGGYPSIFIVAVGPSSGGTLTYSSLLSSTDTATPFESPILDTSGAALLLGFYAPFASAGTSVPSDSNGFSALDVIGSNLYWQGATLTRDVMAAGSYNTSVTDAVSPIYYCYNAILAIHESGPPPALPLNSFQGNAFQWGMMWTGSASTATQFAANGLVSVQFTDGIQRVFLG